MLPDVFARQGRDPLLCDGATSREASGEPATSQRLGDPVGTAQFGRSQGLYVGLLRVGQHDGMQLAPLGMRCRPRRFAYSSNVDDIAIGRHLWQPGCPVVGCWWQRVTLSDLVALAKLSACCACSLLCVELRHQHGTLRVPVYFYRKQRTG